MHVRSAGGRRSLPDLGLYPLEETVEAMMKLKEQGKIRAIGASNVTADLIPELSDEMLADFLKTESGILVNLHVQAIDQTEAIKTIKRKITDLDAMKIQEQKKAVRSGTQGGKINMDLLNTFASLFSNFGNLTWQMVVMWGIGALLIYLAIAKKMEPSLLLPMGFGAILVNLPLSGAITQGDTVGPISALFEAGMSNELFPLLLFIGIGAMIDFGPLLEKPWLMLFGAAAQFGIFFTLLGGDFFARENAFAEQMTVWRDPYARNACHSTGQDDILAFRHSVCLSADVTAAYDPNWASAFEPMNGTYAGRGVAIFKYTGGGSKGSASDACAELVGEITRMLDNGNVAWQIGELGRLDLGGGGTIAKYVANRGIPVLDIGVPVLSMHAPFEVIHKNDLYMAYRAFSLFNNAQ